MEKNRAFLLLLTFAAAVASSHPKSIDVQLAANWAPTSLFVETSLYLAEHTKSTFWEFAETLMQKANSGALETLTDAEQYGLTKDIVEELSGPTTAKVLEYSLATRFYSVKARLFQQILETQLDQSGLTSEDIFQLHDCPCIVQVGDSLTCVGPDTKHPILSAESLASLDPNPFGARVHNFDHLYVPPDGLPSGNDVEEQVHAVVILYADFTSKSSLNVHLQLADLAAEGSISYVLRPKNPSSNNKKDTKNYLQGFGVELAVKNMEYKVLDDTKIELEEEEDIGHLGLLDLDEDAQAVFIKGFDFDRLIQRRPELEDELSAFRTRLLADDAGESTSDIKVWDLANLGVQATQQIIKSKDPLSFMTELCQNFPMYTTRLTKIKVNQTVKEAMVQRDSNSEIANYNSFQINGLPIGEKHLNVYSLHEILQQEAQIIDALHAIDLSTASISSLLNLPIDGGNYDNSPKGIGNKAKNTEEHRLIMSSKSPDEQETVVSYLNDLVRDDKYKTWNPSIRELLSPGWPNQLRYVRKNLYTGVMVLDPSTKLGLRLFSRANYFINGFAPLRTGLLFTSVDTAPGTLTQGSDLWSEDLLHSDRFQRFRRDQLNTKADDETTSNGHNGDDKDGDEKAQRISLPMGERIARIYHWFEKKWNPKAATKFLQLLADKESDIDLPTLRKVFKRRCSKLKVKDDIATKYKQIMRSENYGRWYTASQEWISHRGLNTNDNPIAIINGRVSKFTEQTEFRDILMGSVLRDQQRFTRLVYYGKLNDDTDLEEFLNQDAVPRISEYLVSAVNVPTFVESIPNNNQAKGHERHFGIADDEFSSHERDLSYFSNQEASASLASATFWIVIDVCAVDNVGWNLLQAAVAYLKRVDSTSVHRMAFLTNSQQSCAFSAFLDTLNANTASSSSDRTLQLLEEGMALVGYLRAVHSGENKGEEESKEEIIQGIRAVLSSADTLIQDFNSRLRTFPAPSADVHFAIKVVGLSDPHKRNAIVINGRVVVLPTAVGDDNDRVYSLEELQSIYSKTNIQGDLSLLAEIDQSKFKSQGIVDILLQEQGSINSDAVMQTSFLLAKRAASASKYLDSGVSKKSMIPFLDQIEGANIGVLTYTSPTSFLDIRACLDPISEAAQTISSILLALRDTFDCSLSIVLKPQVNVGKIPIKRFFRYSIAPSLSFDKSGALQSESGVQFKHLYTKNVLTMGIHTPESWLVEATQAYHDLDNIRLGEIERDTLSVRYGLTSLLFSGQVFDLSTGDVPAGLQLFLGSSSHNPLLTDSIVMQNLGYLQLQANPGVWQLRMENAAAQVFEWDTEQLSQTIRVRGQQSQKASATEVSKSSNHNNDSQDKESDPNIDQTHTLVGLIPITSFNDPFSFLRFRRVPGKENVRVESLSSSVRDRRRKNRKTNKANPLANAWNSLFGSGDESETPKHNEIESDLVSAATKNLETNHNLETVHVFSLASGHLYERFLRIMMLSVIRNTKNPVKFWFIKNFLSPEFRAFAPEMAKEYGYEVEFVTYKWPVWLRQQTEKQRIIWGYKILFLDVLFPLNLERIIYIDADQVVRGDVRELWDLELKPGAPYAYTPFCNSNQETKGHRFWDSGYWAQHLGGKPYHISALYVVDLDRFRKMRAGDMLRMMYDNLSQDPNSLANLDQDLPNYAQHQVPIHSLPQEWLWCQTWCSMETLPTAKTIDLCNNPLTKTPKLEVAKTLLPEWVSLDEEATNLFYHNKNNS